MEQMKKETLATRIDNLIEKHETIAVLILILVMGILLSYDFWDSYPLHTTTDELGAIVGAATLAGYDWSGVIDKSGYYGFGFYSLYAPLFKLHLSPILIYRIILVSTRFIRAGIIVSTSYYIGKHYLKFSSNCKLMVLCAICTIPLHSNDDANIINDVVIDVFLWLLIYSVCKITENIENNRKCLKWILFYCAIGFSSLFLHTRAIVMVIATLIVLVAIFIYKRRRMLCLSLSIIPLVGIAQLLIQNYQNAIWAETEGTINNTTVSVASGWKLSDIRTWEIWADMLIGHTSVQGILTGGLFLLSVIVFVKYIYILITRKKAESIYVNILLAVSILCMGAVLSAFMASGWFLDMYHTWNTVDMGKLYSYKALCYVRYWNVFAMPFLFAGVYLVSKKQYRDCVIGAVVAGIVLVAVFVGKVLPVVKENSSAGSYLFTYLTSRNEKVTEQFYYKTIIICALAVALAILINNTRKYKEWAVLPAFLLMIVGYHLANVNYNEYVKERISSMVMASYEQKCELENEGVEIGKIYAYDDRTVDRNWYIFSVLQFYFYDYRIEDEYPREIGDHDIIITYDRCPQIEEDFPQLQCYRLDENEVWYTNIELGRQTSGDL